MRGHIRGKGIVNALVDLPLALSPVVVGLALLLLYGNRLARPWLDDHGIEVVFALPGLVLATIFVSLPFVVREVVPVLREIGTEQEQAASTLGASALQIFRRVTLPGDPLGRRVRRRPDDRPLPRRVRRGLGHLRPHRRQDRDDDAVRPGAVRRLSTCRARTRPRSSWRCCRVVTLVAMTVFRPKRGELRGHRGRGISKRFGEFVALEDVSIERAEPAR